MSPKQIQQERKSKRHVENNKDALFDEVSREVAGSSSELKRKRRQLSAYKKSEIIVERKIKTLTELQALAFEQKHEGTMDLAEFLKNPTPRVVSDILNSAWEIYRALRKR